MLCRTGEYSASALVGLENVLHPMVCATGRLPVDPGADRWWQRPPDRDRSTHIENAGSKWALSFSHAGLTHFVWFCRAFIARSLLLCSATILTAGIFVQLFKIGGAWYVFVALKTSKQETPRSILVAHLFPSRTLKSFLCRKTWQPLKGHTRYRLPETPRYPVCFVPSAYTLCQVQFAVSDAPTRGQC